MIRVQPCEGSDAQRWQLRQATRQMEAQFLHHLLRAMRRTLPTAQSSYASQMYTDMMDEALAQQLAQSGRFGLGRLLYEKLSPLVQTSTQVSGGTNDEQTR